MEPLIKPGIYLHYKGRKYRVIGTAHHTETNEHVVVYQALYGERELWVRPSYSFDTWVTDRVDYYGPRFVYLGRNHITCAIRKLIRMFKK